MPVITTREIKLVPNEFFKILLALYFKKRWWFWACIIVVAGSSLAVNIDEPVVRFLTYFLIAYPFLLVLQYWKYAHSKDNKIFLMERFYRIDHEKIVGVMEDGTENTILLDHVIRKVGLKEFYLLYIAKTQFIYIPKASFRSGEDRKWFEDEILTKLQ